MSEKHKTCVLCIAVQSHSLSSMIPRIVVVRDQSWKFTAFRKDGVLFWMWTRHHGYDYTTGALLMTVCGMPVVNA